MLGNVLRDYYAIEYRRSLNEEQLEYLSYLEKKMIECARGMLECIYIYPEQYFQSLDVVSRNCVNVICLKKGITLQTVEKMFIGEGLRFEYCNLFKTGYRGSFNKVYLKIIWVTPVVDSIDDLD